MRVQRQAVVIVHGIGEQVPLETLRSFVLGEGPQAAGDESGVTRGRARVFSVPSPAAVSCKDRMYNARWVHDTTVLADEHRTKRPGDERVKESDLSPSDVPTDFYEFYWAPRFRDTTIGDVVGWALSLLRRKRATFSAAAVVGPRAVPRRRMLVLLTALAALAPVAGRNLDLSAWWAASACVLLLTISIALSTHLGLLTFFRTLLVAAAVAFAAGALLLDAGRAAAVLSLTSGALFTAVLAEAGRRVARTLGDAARYLSNGPSSVEENEQIQSGVLTLLEQLHDMREDDGAPRYERIVVVGHSLGAVIAYDAVTLLWQRRQAGLVLPPPEDETSPAARAAREVERRGQDICPGDCRIPQQRPADSDQLTGTYRDAQASFAAALRNASDQPERTAAPRCKPAPAVSRRWIITDLVTLGGPLAYADAFLATDTGRLLERFQDRSLHSCPPVPQRAPEARRIPYRVGIPVGKTYPNTVPHNGATFAAVRWTNRYFAHDIVGGPVAPHFGYGIDDRPLTGDRKWLGWFVLAFPHTSYWKFGRHAANNPGTRECRELLHDLIRRDPVYVMTCAAPTDSALLDELVELLTPDPKAASTVRVDVRLQVGDRSRRTPAYLPISTTSLPVAANDDAITALLKQPTELVFGTDPYGEIGGPSGSAAARHVDPGEPVQQPTGAATASTQPGRNDGLRRTESE